MITINEVRQIMDQLFSENALMLEHEGVEDISCMVYRKDTFEYGGKTLCSRHIDIEFSFGEFYEIPETSPAFRFICGLCCPTLSEEACETILYQNPASSRFP